MAEHDLPTMTVRADSPTARLHTESDALIEFVGAPVVHRVLRRRGEAAPLTAH